MSKYLKKFQTTSQYNAYTADTEKFILPNVSLCVNENKVHYNPIPDPYGGHDYVEIDGLKWATMNVGASSPTDAGLYFQWGDISGYTASQVGTDKVFNWANYKYGNGTSSPGTEGMTKYNSTDGKTVLDASDDAVVANWGGSWRMPTNAEFAALVNAVNTAWTADYNSTGIAGLVCTAKDGSGAQLFFPAAGFCRDSSVNNVGSDGDYWFSSLSDDYVNLAAYALYFKVGSVRWGGDYRYLGHPVRGVLDE